MGSTDVATFLLERGMKLHLGCGQTHLDGWHNCDWRKHGPHVDEAFDLMQPWPFKDNSVSAIYASHVLEHLPDPFAFFREAWRVLMPQGRVLLRVPYGGHRSAWGDLTHLRPWFPECFACLQPGYDEATGNPQHDSWQAHFGIGVIDVRLDPHLIPWLKWRLVRRLFLGMAPYVPTVFEEIWADLYALKTPQEQGKYRSTHVPNAVPLRYIVFRHQWEQRELPQGAAAELFPIAEGRPLERAGTHGYTD